MTQTITLVLDGSAAGVPPRGARVRLLGNQTIPLPSPTAIAWQASDRDTGGIFDPAAPTRLRCPDTGKVLLRAGVVWQNDAASPRSATMTMNGALVRGVGYQRVQGPDQGAALSISSSVMDVQAGDYFELLVAHESAGGAPLDVLAHPATWFEIQYADAPGSGSQGGSGASGTQGPPGPQGPQGVPGPAGSADDSALVASLMNQGQCGVNTYYAYAFLMRDGSMRIGGASNYGSLGLGASQTNVVRPMTLPFDDPAMGPIKSIHHNYAGVHVLTQNGEVWGWGYSSYGEVGNTSSSQQNTPQKIFFPATIQPRIVKLVSTLNGSADVAHSWYALDDQGKVWSWGYNGYGQLALGDVNPRFAPVATGFPVANVVVADIEAAGGSYGSIFAVDSNGNAWAAGISGNGQTGLGTSNHALWEKVNLPAPCVKVRATCSGNAGHTLWLLNDGRVFAAGYNGYGEIGNNSTVSVTGNPVAVAGLTGVVDIWAVGGQYGSSFASRSDGAFLAWGNNNQGQLGLGDQNYRTAPTPNPRNNIVAVAGPGYDNYTHTVLLDANGFAYAAGYNGSGQCGEGGITAPVLTHKRISLPAGVQGTLVQVGVAGYSTATATQLLDSRGRVWACGNNGNYMLGLGDTSVSNLFVPARVNL